LLLKELFKYTPKDHVDHDGLSQAIKKVEEVVARLNEERRIIENQIKLAKLDEKIVFEKKQVRSGSKIGRSSSIFMFEPIVDKLIGL
jgi:hypothetical protein